jgi:ComF family protein
VRFFVFHPDLDVHVDFPFDLSRRIPDYLFPALCIACDRPRRRGEKWLCADCESALQRNHEQRDPCPRCAFNRKLGRCECSGGFGYRFDRIFSLFDYDALVKSLLHQVKYRGKKHLAFDYTVRFAKLIPAEVLADIDVLVALPLHPSRQEKRGYNQSHWIAAGIAYCYPQLPVLDGVIRRIRKTKSQATLDRRHRRTNMDGAFAAGPSAKNLSGRRVLLVDDVVTTAATTGAAAEALLSAGCERVRVFSLARD